MTRKLSDIDHLGHELLHDDDELHKVEAKAEELRGRIADLLSDPNAGDGTITLLEDYDEQLKDRGWLSERQIETLDEIEGRRFCGRNRRF